MNFFTLLLSLIISLSAISQIDTSFSNTYLPTDLSYVQSSNGVLSHENGVLLICSRNNYNSTLLMIDSLGHQLWNKEFTTNPSGLNKVYFHDLIATKDSNYLISGIVLNINSNKYGAYCMKINQLGDTLWTNSYQLTGHTGENNAYPVVCTETKDSSYLLSWGYGNHNSSTYQQNFCIAKVENNGTTSWKYAYDADTNLRITDIIEAPDSSIYVFAVTTQYPQKSLIINLHSNGLLNWTKQYENLFFQDPHFSDNTLVIGCSHISGGGNGGAIMRFSLEGNNLNTAAISVGGGYPEHFSLCKIDNGNYVYSRYGDYQGYNTIYVVDSALNFVDSYDVDIVAKRLLNIPNSGIYILGDGPIFGFKSANPEIALIRLDTSFYAPSCIESNNSFTYFLDTVQSSFRTLLSSTPIIQYGSFITCYQSLMIDRFEGCVEHISSLQENTQNQEVKIFPNFSNGIFNLNWQDWQEVSIQVYDIKGTAVLIKNTTGNSAQIDLSEYTEGIYFFILIDHQGVKYSGKLMLVK